MSTINAPWKRRDTSYYSDSAAVVETASGKVRGYIHNGIFTFKGLPYGAPVEGAGRFMPADLPQPWSGVKTCLHYGHICPQTPPPPYQAGAFNADEDQFLLQRTGGRPVGENCLVLNLWTPEINGSGKRPVMVWLHGGGFGFGCGHDLAAYDGENLAHKDVVVITINHRLGLLGHLCLKELGDERYAASGNIASLDMLLALRWVRENIARFGGDPGCVTIFGQSGGGGKVSALMGMPAAQGYFQRAIVQSGSMPAGRPLAEATDIARAVLNELGVEPFKLDKLHELPVEALVTAGFGALRKRGGNPMMGFGPVVDGVVLPEPAFGDKAPACSRGVPMLIGTNFHEFTTGVDNPTAYELSEEQLRDRLLKPEGPLRMPADPAETEKRLDASYKVWPELAPFDRLALVGGFFRTMAHRQAELKASQGGAPAYYYWFTWRTPVLDGRPGAFHSCEISFVFDNADKYETYNGGGEEPRVLSEQMSDAWVAFARTGNPNHPGLPAWPAYKPGDGATMVFDAPCRVEDDPDLRLARAMEE